MWCFFLYGPAWQRKKKQYLSHWCYDITLIPTRLSLLSYRQTNLFRHFQLSEILSIHLDDSRGALGGGEKVFGFSWWYFPFPCFSFCQLLSTEMTAKLHVVDRSLCIYFHLRTVRFWANLGLSSSVEMQELRTIYCFVHKAQTKRRGGAFITCLSLQPHSSET